MKRIMNPAADAVLSDAARMVAIMLFSISWMANLFTQGTGENTPLPVQSGYLEVEGGKLFYEVAGTGDWIVLIHDGIVHREIWNAQFPELAKDHRVVRYDRRGYGKSPAASAPFSPIEDLDTLFTFLKISRATLFGMSAGGGLAIDFTLAHPDKVNGLVLTGAVVSGYGYSSHMLNRGGHLKSLADVMDTNKFIPYFCVEDPYEIFPENTKAKETFLQLLQANPQNARAAMSSPSLPPSRLAVKFLSEIKVPVLILAGEHDIPDVHAHSGVIEAGIPGAKREVILKAGHLIPLEQPEAFLAAVTKFFKSLQFYSTLNSAGAAAAVRYLTDRREKEPDAVLLDEQEINNLGYSYLISGKLKDAIELFRYNTVAWPGSANVYDSLGEAYWKDGQPELAIEYYEKSLRLNPGNRNAEQALKQLRQKKGG